jgi:protein-disulfide isomerase
LCASGLTWIVFRVVNRLPTQPRLRALLGTSEVITDLVVPVDPARDHIRGPHEALVTVVEYGDFECPYCGRAEPVVRELLRDFGDVRYVWRHLPLNDVHPHAQQAAEASEAAARQGAFWEMHDVLLEHQDALLFPDLVGYAASLGLDTEQFAADLRKHYGAARISEDVDSADLSGVSGTPTFFVNGKRHYGAYDIETLSEAVKLAMAHAKISALSRLVLRANQLCTATRLINARAYRTSGKHCANLGTQRTLLIQGKDEAHLRRRRHRRDGERVDMAGRHARLRQAEAAEDAQRNDPGRAEMDLPGRREACGHHRMLAAAGPAHRYFKAAASFGQPARQKPPYPGHRQDKAWEIHHRGLVRNQKRSSRRAGREVG